MKNVLATTALLTMAAFATHAQAQRQFIEASYTVDSIGSTTAVAEFALDGPPPVLYVDLAATLPELSYLESRWYANTEGRPRFTTFAGQVPTEPDKYWFQVPFQEWQDWKYAGPWRVDTTLYSIELILIYGVGVGSLASYDLGSTGFDVVQAVQVPEPSTWAMLGLGLLGVVGAARVRRT